LIFDKEAALGRFDGEVSCLKEIVQLFLEESDKLLAGVEDAVSRGEGKAIEASAHKLKGSLGSLETKAAYQVAARLEALGSERKVALAREGLKALQVEMARVKTALEAFLLEEPTSVASGG
jgi:HPt (histidine-containing phosphotransfer) domain-containing protein